MSDKELPSVSVQDDLRRIGIANANMTRAKLWSRFAEVGGMKGGAPAKLTTDQLGHALIALLRGKDARSRVA